MAEIIDIDKITGGEKSDGKKRKKLNKKQVFSIIAVGVGVVALIMWYMRKRSSSNQTVAYVASGYDGYPVAGAPSDGQSLGGSADLNSYYSDVLTEQEAFLSDYYDGLLTQQENVHNSELEAVVKQYDDQISEYNAVLEERSAEVEKLQNEMSFAEVVAEMTANSNEYHFADQQRRAELVAENERLGHSIGATKNAMGEWYNSDGERLFTNAYEASAQNLSSSTKSVDESVDYMGVVQNLIAGGSAGDSSEVSTAIINRSRKIVNTNNHSASVQYDKNVDYQAAINKAKADGESQAVINTLIAQREAKIKGENLNADGTKKA